MPTLFKLPQLSYEGGSEGQGGWSPWGAAGLTTREPRPSSQAHPRVLSEALAPRADTGALKPEQRHAGRLSHQHEKCNLKGNKWQERAEGRGQRWRAETEEGQTAEPA